MIEPHDRQFSIAAPWPEPPGKKTRVMIDCFGGGEYFIEVRGQRIRFEWSDIFGPLPINKNGTEAKSIGPKHGFWRAVSWWNLQGRKIENGLCVWRVPKRPVYEIKNRFITKVIEPGEEGWDW